jgi:protein-S-isoprenylcysteine O-methyltransferase Ste14
MTNSTERGADVHFPPPLVFLGFTVLGVVLPHALGPIPFPATFGARLLGVLVVLLGVATILSARMLFVRSGQSPIPWKPTPELIFRGPYRFTRNPMYVGITTVQAGLGVALGNVWISVLAPIALLTVHFIAVLPEERYLVEKFGTSYREYRAKVRRYL